MTVRIVATVVKLSAKTDVAPSINLILVSAASPLLYHSTSLDADFAGSSRPKFIASLASSSTRSIMFKAAVQNSFSEAVGPS